MDYQPAGQKNYTKNAIKIQKIISAYFCLWKSIWERALNWRSQQKFKGRAYSQLPSVKLAKGVPEKDVQYFFDQTCHLSIG
jgi:hypothetical protein